MAPSACRRDLVRRIARAVTSVALVAALAGAALVATPTGAGAASPADEATFVSKINALRASKGLAPMTPDAAVAATACTWNDQMIAAGGISHDPNLAAAIASAVPDWRKGGENVGMGGSVSTLFDAFVASPGHYQNLVDPDFSLLGVCVGRDASGKLFTTHRFVAVPSATVPPAPPPTTAAPAPPPPPPTTAAPATAPAPPPPPPTTAAPTTAAPPPPPATTAAPTTPAAAPPTTASTTTTTPGTTPPSAPSSLLVAVLSPSSTPAAESTLAAVPEVRDLVQEILDLFPSFLHLRLP